LTGRVITPEKLAQALDRIHPRDRELLSLSLQRRVPDEALARLYACEPAEVARLRAGAIERLADEMQVHRGEDLGAILKALLEPQTWRAASGEELAVEAGGGRLVALPSPADPEIPVSGLAPAVAPAPPVQEAPPSEPEGPDPSRRPVPLALLGIAVAVLVGAGIIGATQFGGDTSRVVESGGGDGDGTRDFVPAERGPAAAPFPTEPRTLPCYSTAFLRRPTVLYHEPDGRRRMRIAAKTEWGSPRVLGVVERRGDWLGVQVAELPNGEVGWVRRERARLDCTGWSLHADLSKRTVLVRRDGRTVRKLPVAIGRATNPTPKGRFTVTDKLRVTDPDSPYGCCVLALTGHQTNLPAGWPGGDRLAVHATTDESSIGEPASLGCLRTHSGRARWLIETVPLGTPIFIRA
jgi:L,D-transpeptidase catalytic domain